MLHRLVGLETEYAIRFHAHYAESEPPPNKALYHRLVNMIRQQQPTAPQRPPYEGHFLANGGAIHFEASEKAPEHEPRRGLVEAATPECRGPRQLLLYQRAQDLLLTEAARQVCGMGGTISLIKNNRDGENNYYGSHENYELTVASGWRLIAWRMGLVLSLLFTPPAVIAGLALCILLIAIVPLLLVISPLFLVTSVAALLPKPHGSAICLVCALAMFVCLRRLEFHEKTLQQSQKFHIFAYWCLKIVFAPRYLLLTSFFRLVAFHRVRRELTAFLMSRPIVSGSGTLSEDGATFGLSAKAGAIRCQCGVSPGMRQPVFSFAHVMDALFVPLMGGGLERFRALLGSRQRLQVCLNDSNMAQTAEYLRIGTTLLVLDAIEAGELADAPLLSRPLEALRTICADPSLTAKVGLTDGRAWTALGPNQAKSSRHAVVDS